jgi:hypothetical protein
MSEPRENTVRTDDEPLEAPSDERSPSLDTERSAAIESEHPSKDEAGPTTADIASSSTNNDADEDDAAVQEQAEATDDDRQPLLAEDTTSDVRGRWERIQGSFVDEPRRAVEEADSLVAELMQQLADSFAQEREGLESQWDRGDEVSTEDLRIALQRYRSFFDRLLSA